MCMVMNKQLQKYVIERVIRNAGIDPHTVDTEALIDENLSLRENIENIKQFLNIEVKPDEIFLDNAILQIKEDGTVNVEAIYNEREGIVVSNRNNETVSKTESVSEPISQNEIQNTNVEQKLEDGLSDVFERILAESDPIEVFSRYLFPEIVGEQYDFVRKAVLLMLVTQYDTAKRNRIHILLVGEPGCGKTEILSWVAQKFYGIFVNAEHTSKVGLTGDARGKEVVPGVLAEAHGRILCIDELDKMSSNDQSALLQSMEEGVYTIVKGLHRQRFNAEVRVLASANKIENISKPLLDRFDFVIRLEHPDKEQRIRMADKLIEEFFGFYEPPKHKVLIEYLSWIQDFEPKVSKESLEKIKKVIKAYLNLENVDVKGKSIRSFELSILRIAKAIAKLRKEDLNERHIAEAIRLKDPTITDTQFDYLLFVANKPS